MLCFNKSGTNTKIIANWRTWVFPRSAPAACFPRAWHWLDRFDSSSLLIVSLRYLPCLWLVRCDWLIDSLLRFCFTTANQRLFSPPAATVLIVKGGFSNLNLTWFQVVFFWCARLKICLVLLFERVGRALRRERRTDEQIISLYKTTTLPRES